MRKTTLLYLVPQLKAADIHATYDFFQLPADAQQLGRKSAAAGQYRV